jgi:hypothetical protein
MPARSAHWNETLQERTNGSMSDNPDAGLEVLRRVMSRPEPNLWARYGSWAEAGNYDEAASREALEPLDPFMLYPEGDRRALWLPGWDQRSAWGFDPAVDAYFAQLWRNSGTAERDEPDIWIFGRGTFEGRDFAVTTSRVLACEIATATGAGLAEVVSAMLGTKAGGDPQGRLCSGTAGHQGR